MKNRAQLQAARNSSPDQVVYTADEISIMGEHLDGETVQDIHMVKKYFNGELVAIFGESK